jgi:hypothetical protein
LLVNEGNGISKISKRVKQGDDHIGGLSVQAV